MDVDNTQDDQHWDSRERDETEVQRLDRNWNSLLQELRVVQTGVQLLTGFLLTLPFHSVSAFSPNPCAAFTRRPSPPSFSPP